MKKARVVQDVVRTKAAASRGGTGKFRYIKSVAKTASKIFSFKIPFFIWLVVVLAEATYLIKVIPGTNVQSWPFSPLAALINPASGNNVPPKTAIAENNIPELAVAEMSTSTATDTSLDILPAVRPGLLPAVTAPIFEAASTKAAGKKIVTVTARTASKPSAAITAKSLLAATALSVVERYDGPYKIALVTDAGTYGKITWGLDKAVLAVGGSAPTFAVSFSCDPGSNVPAANAADQGPTFDVRTSYACAIGLTPNSGNDRGTQSRQFSFTTGAGQLVVTPAVSMNTVLRDGGNDGGLVFNNENSEPMTISALDVDVSYKGINVANGPLVLRFEDPATNVSLADYHLETLAADPSSPYAHAGTDIHIPLSFTIPAASQKMLPVSVLGVEKLHVDGLDPDITITVRQVITDSNSNKSVLNSAEISWSCVTVPIGSYDPNATSGPYASGQACLQ